MEYQHFKNFVKEIKVNAIIVIKFSTLEHRRVSRINKGIAQVTQLMK